MTEGAVGMHDRYMSEKKSHWETVYSTKPPEKLSWTQPAPSPSLEWIVEALPKHDGRVIDIGGGISELVDRLLEKGFVRPAVLDISSAALSQAKARLGDRSREVEWIEADITSFERPSEFSLWHDRAVFHFLTAPEDRRRYVSNLKRSLRPGGFVLLATFSPEGPAKCSGLDVMRYDEEGLAAELGPEFRLVKSERKTHTTPWGASQAFVYTLFARQ